MNSLDSMVLGRGFVSRVQSLRVQRLNVSSRVEHEGLYTKVC